MALVDIEISKNYKNQVVTFRNNMYDNDIV